VAASLAMAGAVLSGTGAPAQAGWSNGATCAGTANGVGVSLYCLSGNSGGVMQTLAQRFPGVDFHNCVDHPLPVGMRPPGDRRSEEGKYWLQSCLSNVNFDTVGGGRHIGVTLGFHFVGSGEDAYTEDRLNELERAVWDTARSNAYPVPIMTASPTHVPRVNVPTFFHFRWMTFEEDGTATPAHEPGSGNFSDPYLHIDAGHASLTARSVGVTVDPQIEDVDPIECGANPPRFETDEPPDPDVQDSNCYMEFEHSSAAADELSTSDIPLPDVGDDYPLPVYVLKVTVRWHAEMQTGGVTEDLGLNDFVAYQQLPVTEVLGNAGLEF
jgi:hypothetical protein